MIGDTSRTTTSGWPGVSVRSQAEAKLVTLAQGIRLLVGRYPIFVPNPRDGRLKAERWFPKNETTFSDFSKIVTTNPWDCT